MLLRVLGIFCNDLEFDETVLAYVDLFSVTTERIALTRTSLYVLVLFVICESSDST